MTVKQNVIMISEHGREKLDIRDAIVKTQIQDGGPQNHYF